MQVIVSGKQIDVGDALRGHVETTLGNTVEKYVGSAIEAHVVFHREAHMIRSDVTLHVGRGIVVQGQGSGNEAYAAFDSAAERLGKRVRRYKQRLQDHRARVKSPDFEAVPARSYVLVSSEETHEPAAEAPDGQPVIVAEVETEIPRFTLSEAVMRLELGEQGAVVFHHRANGRLNVVYRRPDGNVGWIDPDSEGKSGNKGQRSH